MFQKFLHFIHYFTKRKMLKTADSAEAIREIGHRNYVGGKWDEIGRLQFDFMKSRGLEPRHVFLDIACGSLRAGVQFIPYLETGHYLGIEKEKDLVEAGIEKELGRALFDQKKPEIVVSNAFEFSRFSKTPDFALAHALFTHLTPALILLCMKNLRAFVPKGCRFYATFFETASGIQNPATSQDHTLFYYTRAEMAAFGEKTGWKPVYIGDWKHPRKQIMMEYLAV